jgi:hypothetical protein
MKLISAVLSELLALFVDDGVLALGILAWLGGGWLSMKLYHFPADVEAILLFLGLSALLIKSVQLAAKAQKSAQKDESTAPDRPKTR